MTKAKSNKWNEEQARSRKRGRAKAIEKSEQWQRTTCKSVDEYCRSLEPRLWPSRRSLGDLLKADLQFDPWTGRYIERLPRDPPFRFRNRATGHPIRDNRAAWRAGYSPERERDLAKRIGKS